MNPKYTASLAVFLASCLLFLYPIHATESETGTELSIPDEILLWDIEPASGVSDEDARLLTSFVAAEAQNNGTRVRSKASVDKALKLEEQRQQCGADDVGCLAEVGNALGLDVALSGSIGKLGGTWIFSLQLMDVRRVTVIKSITRRAKGNIDAIVDQVPGMVREVLGKSDIASLEEPGKPMSTYTLWGHVTFWSGLASIGVAGAMTALGKKAERDYQESASTSEEDAINNYKYSSIALYTIGGALVVTGATLWIMNALGADNIAGSGITLAPTVSPEYTGATVQVTF